MKITRRIAYFCHSTAGRFELVFVPVKNVPGFSHKVSITKAPTTSINVVNCLSSDFRPSKKTAEYFFKKHILPDGTISHRTHLAYSSATPDKQTP